MVKVNLEFLNKAIAAFVRKATMQEKKGVEKYGVPLNPMNDQWDWLNMADDELVDGYKYLTAERERRDTVLCMVLNEIESTKVELLKDGLFVERGRALAFVNRLSRFQTEVLRLTKNVEAVPVVKDLQDEIGTHHYVRKEWS